MPMSDELAGATLNYSLKALEIAAELVKMVAPTVKQGTEKLLGIIAADKDNMTGKVDRATLFSEAKAEKSSIMSTSNFIDKDAEQLAAKAKQYGIPVSFIGKDGKQTMEFLSRDEPVVKQMIQDVMQERLKEAPQNVKSFAVSESNITSVKEQLEKNGVECQFAQTANGKIYCMYPAAEAEKVATIKQELKSIQSGIADNFKAERKNGVAVMEDATLGISISFVNEKNQPLTKSHVMEVMQEQFGYTKAEADIAANKFCDDLGLDKKAYLIHNEQLDKINAMKTNIKLESDSVLLKDNTFSAINFKGGTGTHIFITNGDKGAALTPGSMTETEMKNICITSLNMSEQQADEAVKKSLKIDSQINSKLKETTIYREGGSQMVNINRTSHSSFSVMVGKTKRMYDFNDKDLAAKMCKDFGITEGKAQNIIDKAKKQGTIGNKVHDGLKKAADTIKPKTSEIGKIGKGVKR